MVWGPGESSVIKVLAHKKRPKVLLESAVGLRSEVRVHKKRMKVVLEMEVKKRNFKIDVVSRVSLEKELFSEVSPSSTDVRVALKCSCCSW